MRRSRGRAAGVVAVVAVLASGCALVVGGLDTDFSVPDDGAAPTADAARQDATMTAADAADAGTFDAQPPAPAVFAAFPLCSTATTDAWHLDCSFGDGGSVVVGTGVGIAAPLLTEGAGSAAVCVAVARETGTFLEGIDVDGGRTVLAVADAGVPVDLTTTNVAFAQLITMLSNSVVDGTSGTMAPVITSTFLQGTPIHSTSEISMAAATLDASVAAVRPLAAPTSETSGEVTLSYFVNYLDGAVPFAPGMGITTVGVTQTGSGYVDATIEPLDASGQGATGVDIGPIANGVYIQQRPETWVVGFGSDGGSSSYVIPGDAAPATPFPLLYVVDDCVEVTEEADQFGYPFVAGRVDGGARVDSLDPSTAGSSLPNFSFDDPGVGPLRLRAAVGDVSNELLVAGASSSTGNLYLALYSFDPVSAALTADPAFGDGGSLMIPLQFPAQLGSAVSSQGAYYVSLTLTDADAGADAGVAVVIRIAPPGSP